MKRGSQGQAEHHTNVGGKSQSLCVCHRYTEHPRFHFYSICSGKRLGKCKSYSSYIFCIFILFHEMSTMHAYFLLINKLMKERIFTFLPLPQCFCNVHLPKCLSKMSNVLIDITTIKQQQQ